MTRPSDLTRRDNERELERRMVRAALCVQPKRVSTLTGAQVFWRSEITPADVRTGREYERAAIAAAEREARRKA